MTPRGNRALLANGLGRGRGKEGSREKGSGGEGSVGEGRRHDGKVGQGSGGQRKFLLPVQNLAPRLPLLLSVSLLYCLSLPL